MRAAASRAQTVKPWNQVGDVGNVARASLAGVECFNFSKSQILTDRIELFQQLVIALAWGHRGNAVEKSDFRGSARQTFSDYVAHLCTRGFLLLRGYETQITTHDHFRRHHISLSSRREVLIF